MSLIDANTLAVLAPGVLPPASAITPGGVDVTSYGGFDMGAFSLTPGFMSDSPSAWGGTDVLPDGGVQSVDTASIAMLNSSSSTWQNIAGLTASLGTTLANVINSLKNGTPLGANSMPPGVTAKPLVSQTAMPWLLIGGVAIAAFLIFKKG